MNHFFYLFTIHHWADGGSNDIVHQRKAKTTHQTNKKKPLCDVIQVFGRQGTEFSLKVAMFTLYFSPLVTPLVGNCVADAGLTFERIELAGWKQLLALTRKQKWWCVLENVTRCLQPHQGDWWGWYSTLIGPAVICCDTRLAAAAWLQQPKGRAGLNFRRSVSLNCHHRATLMQTRFESEVNNAIFNFNI